MKKLLRLLAVPVIGLALAAVAIAQTSGLMPIPAGLGTVGCVVYLFNDNNLSCRQRVEVSDEYASLTASRQTLAGDMTLSGTGLGKTGGYLGGVMGNVIGGSSITAAGNNGANTAGVIGKYSLAGTGYTPGYLRGGVIGEASGVADCAVCAIASDSTFDSQTVTVKALFGVDVQFGNSPSTYDFVVSGKHSSHDVYTAKAPTKCDIELFKGMWVCGFDTAITANSTTTTAPSGSLGVTSHGTGAGKIFISDGSKWQNPTN